MGKYFHIVQYSDYSGYDRKGRYLAIGSGYPPERRIQIKLWDKK